MSAYVGRRICLLDCGTHQGLRLYPRRTRNSPIFLARNPVLLSYLRHTCRLRTSRTPGCDRCNHLQPRRSCPISSQKRRSHRYPPVMGLVNDSLSKAISNRPIAIRVCSGLLAFNSGVLILSWFVKPSLVNNHGGEIFFIALWGCLAYATFNAWGWVKATITGIWVAYLWGLLNGGNILDGVATTTPADLLTKILGLVALVLLWLPTTRTWYLHHAQERSGN